MPYQVRAKTACDAVGYDRDRFNEDVAAGAYGCAPATGAGRARVFEEPDLVALYVFAFFRRFGLSAEIAGGHACRVGDQARNLLTSGKEIAGDVVVGFDHVGASFCAMGDQFDATLDGKVNVTRSPMVFAMRFGLANILTIVKGRIEELTAPRGED